MEVVLKRKNDNTFLKFFILYISDHELVTGRCQFPNGPVYFNFWNRIFTEFQWIGANLYIPPFSHTQLENIASLIPGGDNLMSILQFSRDGTVDVLSYL